MIFIFYSWAVLISINLCRLRGVYAAIASFLLFAMIQFRDGPFVRPHPAFWRIILGVNLVYELALVFLLFQDVGTARHMLTYIDSNLGVPLPEKSYAEDCSLTPKTLWVWPSFILLSSDFQRILECDRYLLLSACSGMVREGNDSTGLLVLLG